MTKVKVPFVDLGAQYAAIKDEVDAAVASVVGEAAFIGTGGNRFTRRFEEEFAAFVGAKWCIACGNGTDALEIILKAAGLGPGDEVLVPAVSWIATSEAVSSCGATPVFVDVVPGRYTMDVSAAEAKIGSRTRAVIPVHLYGLPAEMDQVGHLAERFGLFVIEDCAQAHGARLGGQQVGTFGHAAAYSFFPGKNLGAWGDAGAILTNDDGLATKARAISQHGQTARRHDHIMEGRNSRMDGLQGAILSVKLNHLPEWTAARRRLAAVYRKGLTGVVHEMQVMEEDDGGVYHLFVVEVPGRESVIDALAEEGIATAVHYPRPLPLLPAYERFGHVDADFPVAARATSRILSLPLFPEMDAEQQDAVIAAVRRAVPRGGAADAPETT